MSAPTMGFVEQSPPPWRRCSKCSRRHRRRGQRYCRACHAAYMREHRPTHSQLTKAQRIKANCRSYTNTLIARGVLVRGPCQWPGCVRRDTQAHHPDYAKPRLVIWYCRPHHLAHHRTEGVQSVHVVNTPGHAGQEGKHP